MTGYERVLNRTTKPDGDDGCWLWQGRPTLAGYGMISVEGKRAYTHRIVYEAVVGAIPQGLELDHICRVRHCVNPKHLEAVTHRENMLRSHTFVRRYVSRTHCDHGHEFTPENTYMDRGYRSCRTCVLVGNRRRRLVRNGPCPGCGGTFTKETAKRCRSCYLQAISTKQAARI